MTPSTRPFTNDTVMRMHLCHKNLWSKCSRPRRRRAFSLAELVVSIGILVLMFALAGQVFSLSIQSTGQATALTELSRLLRAFEQTLREDLAQVEPGRSVMLIQGNPVNAYWTQQGKDGDANDDPSDGYGHLSDPSRETDDVDESGIRIPQKPRADMLMLFTARRSSSFAHAQSHPGLSSNLQQVVYGHAEPGEYVAVEGSAALGEGP